MPKAIVLGSRPGSGNIGEAVATYFRRERWQVEEDDCAYHNCGDSEPHYRAPSSQEVGYEDASALIVSLGRTSMDEFYRIDHSEIEAVIYGCLTLPLLCAQNYVEERGGKGGNIIFVGSYAHRHPFSTGTAYCAAKAGIDMATKTLAWEVTDRGFQVNCVHPYHVEGTPMWEQVQEGVMRNKSMTREQADEYAHKDAQMELARPSEIAGAIFALVNTRSLLWSSGSSVELFGGTR